MSDIGYNLIAKLHEDPQIQLVLRFFKYLVLVARDVI